MVEAPLTYGAAAMLVLFRIGGLALIAPFLASRIVPIQVRGALAVLLTIVITPIAISMPGAVPELNLLSLVTETFVGFGLGFGAAILVGAADMAGDILATQTGLSGASVLDPLTGQGSAAMGQLLSFMVIVLLLVTGGHLVMIESLAGSFAWVPLGSSPDLLAGATSLIRVGAQLFAHGLQFAAPVVGAVGVGYVALGVLARTAPQLNVLAVSFPLQIALGLLVLGAALPLLATHFASWPIRIDEMSGAFVRALAGGY
jgi:flagellar biosynthetic protein FliR